MNIIKPPARDVGRSLRSERYKEMSKIKKLIDGINAGIQSTKELGDETDTITMTLPEMEYTAKAIREKQERQNPQPLTLDKLIRMDGEPIWTVTIGLKGSGHWELCEGYTIRACPFKGALRCVDLSGEATLYDYKTYGKTWIAYRTKPEGSGEWIKKRYAL